MNITNKSHFAKILKETRQSAFILLHKVRHGHRTEKDTRGAAYHSTLSRKQKERRMPIDRQRGCAVEGYSQRVGIEIRDVLV